MTNGNDLYNMLDKEPCPLLTFAELREQMKHIAVLCIGLSIDLSNKRGTLSPPKTSNCAADGSIWAYLSARPKQGGYTFTRLRMCLTVK